MNRTMSVLKMHARDKVTWFYIPLSILLFNFVINLIVSFIPSNSTQIYTGGVIPIYIYIFVMGTITLSQTFPFALGLSITRKNYFLGTTTMITLVSAIMACLLCIASLIERLTNHWGGFLHFFNIPYLNDGTLVEQLCIYFIIMMFMYFVGLSISSVHRRYGGLGMLILVVLVALLFGTGGFSFYQYQWVDTLIRWLNHVSAFDIALWMIPLTICCAILSYLLLRKSTI
ncbi:hypothetical protein [Paenibacillus glacialis]|uniref:Uncharacterized protein n=1 Tax=Paenibacillus glacialis TaxID=494026 RepID=A0A168INW3_9BACL|nr:hypothetical protein [Paenibacillus glacialis]OAB39525.1 hypothetical protein PGLA_19175 [Paenibacillus glacialis]